ncbi:lysosome-associated membrane glycoprotein 2-like isoform X1 [Anguilla rostrata]|uniref:lysosome-associated membrane glycoprotein 2-like isoform X1 n=1 Tax=Anguilla rostrata TaxID=7938 RepID=UPI0030D231A7
MSHYAFLVLLLILGSDTLYAVDISGTPDPASVTDPAPVPTGPTTVPAVELTTAASNSTTAPPPEPTTAASNSTTAPAPVPTTAASNSTTAPAPVPTTAASNSTTAPAPVPTTAASNRTTEPPLVPTTAASNSTTAPAPVPTTAASNSTTEPPLAPTTAPTNATTAPPPVPTTAGNGTTAPPPQTTTAAPSPMPPPSVGNYSVRNDVNSTACLMATMGLQISYKDGEVFKTINLDPNVTTATGKCGINGSDASLLLTFDKSAVAFTFSEEGGKFRLHGVSVTLNLDATGTFYSGNANLSLWEGSLGSSYMCRRDQTYNITDVLILRTRDLQVQPYMVENNSYSTAEDCPADADESFIVPLIVGASLGVLTLIVLVAYLVGRSRSQNNGYQSL